MDVQRKSLRQINDRVVALEKIMTDSVSQVYPPNQDGTTATAILNLYMTNQIIPIAPAPIAIEPLSAFDL